MGYYDFYLASSLEKVFPDERPAEWREEKVKLLASGRLSFQLVYFGSDLNRVGWNQVFKVEVKSGAKHRIRTVELIPSELPAWPHRDRYYLRTTPGLYPDLLKPSDGTIKILEEQYRSLWIDISYEEAGKFPLEITVKNNAGEQCFSRQIEVEVLGEALPEQSLLHTQWYHSDGMAAYYGYDILSDKFWETTESFIRFAGEEARINMLLTPIFTPALDTEVGGERTTVQLVQIKKENGIYSFNFDHLKKWCELCNKYGVTHLEIAHLFTQWGAYFTPKVMALVDGKEERIFGWDVKANSKEYREFLEAFIPSLLEFLTQMGYTKDTLRFHVSDEPSSDHLESYLEAKKQVADLLEGYIIMDALSNYSYYEQGIIKHPVPSNDHVHDFIGKGVEDLWVYYCCAQSKDVPNRFFSMPSSRNRIMGTLMYLYDIKGFLHWGYNFYNSQFSKMPINPFIVTDAGRGFESGDAFLVYPGPDGEVYSSIRNEVQVEGIEDISYLQALEKKKGRAFVEELITKVFGYYPTFSNYPVRAEVLLELRKAVAENL